VVNTVNSTFSIVGREIESSQDKGMGVVVVVVVLVLNIKNALTRMSMDLKSCSKVSAS
jgi:hypothetical protein